MVVVYAIRTCYKACISSSPHFVQLPGPGPFVPFERLKFFENFHPHSHSALCAPLRLASPRLASPRLASSRLAAPPLAMHTVAAGSSPVVRTEEWINSELLPPP
ncbi:hypothetical protein G5I_01434 [Acromyrmex echinatior]|uniref:Uncharacterized protein n=1 Tax=Acromyrmex echinatior TaxID=103372 RepID=F4W7L8_ACREC|nr:hypothetical protein G5I_01434 [Acromyrmex echinatior]